MGKSSFEKLMKYLNLLVDTRAAGTYMILFATVIGVATFIENDFGTSSAQKVIYKSWWFELLLLLFAITLVRNIFKFRMIQRGKWAVFVFHLSILFILLGAGVTRYFGYEGMMHIRENDSSNVILSSENYLQFEVFKDGRSVRFDERVIFASLGNNHWEESYLVGNDLIEVSVERFIPNPVQALIDSEEGIPIIQVVFSGAAGREEYFISHGQTVNIKNVRFNFSDEIDDRAVNINYMNDSLYLRPNRTLTRMTMATQQLDTIYPVDGLQPLQMRSLYSDGINNFVFSAFNSKGTLEIISESHKVKNESLMALLIKASVNGETQETYVVGKKGLQSNPVVLDLGGLNLSIAYGAKQIVLPFYLKLYDFVMERYPGTDSPMSYASEVQLVDDRKNVSKDYRIYMNNILNYGGFRFFQSSYDKDERGTYLSVNHDFWGTWISYFGYFLLTLGLVMTFFSKNSRFYQLTKMIKALRDKRHLVLIGLIFMSSSQVVFAQKVINPISQLPILDEGHADRFSRLVVQDFNGRMKPMHTLSREVMRKLARSESLYGLSADQVILSMYVDRGNWEMIPMIKMGKNAMLRDLLDVRGDFASFRDFFDENGSYILVEEVRRANELQPIDRGTYEKELIKIDERANIANLIFTGRMFRIIPVPGDPNNTWMSAPPRNAPNFDMENFSPAASRFFTSYQPALFDALHSQDYTAADRLLEELSVFQKSAGGEVVPSDIKLKAEIFLNNLNVFNRLSLWYILVGIGFLSLLFTSIFKPDLSLSKVYWALLLLTFAGFIFHTSGLAIRWYVSERAPWSNGYESMIYISWTATLAGILFTRKSIGGMAATLVLAGTILLVAQLSYLDPEITPLVPVLRSYWLTIHVSLVAGSYGFLMLGALIGLLNLILMIFLTYQNRERIGQIIKEMSLIGEMTLIGGLVMLSVGTYLGGVWANESWGRYWGWDAKETWALVTILIYAFILHMRLIPKLKGLYAFNLATLFGWASVIMTYFGVNYYLSGLHSYAAGDPVPIPGWVYMAVVMVTVISILAYVKKRKYPLIS